MTHRPIMPSRALQEVIHQNEPHLLQRPWWFTGFISPSRRGNSEFFVGHVHGSNPDFWTQMDKPDIRDSPRIVWTRIIPLPSIISHAPLWYADIVGGETFVETRIWIGACESCPKVFWMMDAKGRILKEDLRSSIS